jgi:hypothetical protein
LNKNYCLKIDPDICVECGVGALPKDNRSGRIAVVGASHSRQLMASVALKSVSTIKDLPRWTPENEIVDEIAKLFTDTKLTESDCVVLDLFLNDAYIGTTPRGFSSPPFRDDSGKWHVEGSVDVVPLKSLRIIAKMAVTLVKACGSAKVIIMLPLPRYVLAACCNNRKHVVNLDEDDYESILTAAAHVVRSLMEEELEESSRQPVFFNPVAAFSGEDLRSMAADGSCVWQTDDPVHLTEAAYDAVGVSLLELWQNPDQGSRRQVASIVEGYSVLPTGGRGGGGGRGGRGGGGRGQHGQWRGRGDGSANSYTLY